MVYLIELSINLHKIKNLSNIQQALVKKAKKCGMETYYKTNEFIENKKYCIILFNFANEKKLIVSFIKYVKILSEVNIETIGYDNFSYQVMYISNKYLNKMNIEQAKKYLEEKKNGELYEQGSIILKAINNKEN